MQTPPEIKVRDIEMTTLIDKMISRGLAGLEKVCDYIISAHITLERTQGRRQTGNVHNMRIDIRIPDRPDIVVKRSSAASKKTAESLARLEIREALDPDLEEENVQSIGRSPNRGLGKREEPVIALIRRTFDSAQRELRKTVEKQRGEVRIPAQKRSSAVVEKIFENEGYGFLRTVDSHEQVYFSHNSLLHRHWQNLTVGSIVRFTSENGEKGLQASTVELVDKRGAGEMHGNLHDLPDIPPVSSAKKV